MPLDVPEGFTVHPALDVPEGFTVEPTSTPSPVSTELGPTSPPTPPQLDIPVGFSAEPVPPPEPVTLGESMAVGGTSMVGNLLKGASLLGGNGPVGSSLDWLARAVYQQGAFGISMGADPLVKQRVAEAAEGPLIGEGAGNTWTSLIGQQLPLLGFTLATAGGGGAAAKALGAVGAGVKAAEVASGALGFAGVQAGGFSESAKAYGIDEDIAKRKALSVGTVSGALQEAMMLTGIGPFKRAIDFTLGRLPKTPIIQTALKELGLLTGAGASMAGMDAVSEAGMESAISEMKARYGKDWKPAEELPTTDLLRSGVEGALLTAVTRAAGRTASIPMALVRQQELKKQILAQKGDQIDKILREGGTFKDVEKAMHTETTAPDIRIEPPYWNEFEERIRNSRTEDQVATRLDELRSESPKVLYRIAKTAGIDVRGEGKKVVRPVDDILFELKQKIGSIKEGPMFEYVPDPKNPKGAPIRQVVADKPIIDPVPPEEAKLTERLDSLVRNVLKNAKDLTTLPTSKPDAVKTQMLFDIRRKSLEEAGLSPELAKHHEINNIFETELSKGDQGLTEKLTRQQLAKYRLKMEGELTKLVSREYGKAAETWIRPSLFYKFKPPPMTDENGKPVHITTTNVKEMPGFSLMFEYIRANPWPFIQVANKTGLNLMGLDMGLVKRRNLMHQAMLDFSILHKRTWKDMPKPLTYGTVRSAMRDLTVYLMEEQTHRDLLAKQWGIKATRQNQLRAVAQRVVDAAGGKKSWLPGTGGKAFTVDEILNHGKTLAGRYRELFDWFVKSGAISWDRYRKDYVPIYMEFAEDAKAEGMSFNEWVDKRREDWKKTKQWDDSRIDEMVDFGDTLASLQRKGFNVPGESTPFYEYARTHDREFMKMFKRDTNIEDLIDNYAMRHFKKIYFEDAVPAVRAFLDNTFHELRLNGVNDTALKTMLTNYLDDIMGIPGAVTKTARTLNLRSDRYEVGKIINNFANWYNENWGHKRLGAIPDKIDPIKMSDAILTGAYAWFLGLPNWKSPLKNIATQNPAAAMLGLDTWIHGALALSDPKRRQEIRDMGLRSEVAIPDFARTAHGRMKAFAEFWLSVYQASEMEVNVATAASTAMYAFDRLKPFLAKDPKLKNMTKADFDRLVFKGWMDRRKVTVANTPASERMPFQKEFETAAPRAFKAVSTEMFDMIRKGKSADARKMLIQNIVDMSQYRYGHGGSMRMLKNPLGRMLGMFMTWPANYMEMQAMLWNPKNGMMKRAVGMWATQLLVATLLTQMGLKAYNWIGTGAMPEELGFFGPIAQLIKNLFGVIRSGGVSAQAEMMPGVSDEDRRKARKEYERWLTELHR